MKTNDRDGCNGIYRACALVSVAFVFDVLDGRIARWRRKTSAMGRDLDSLADIVSCCVRT